MLQLTPSGRREGRLFTRSGRERKDREVRAVSEALLSSLRVTSLLHFHPSVAPATSLKSDTHIHTSTSVFKKGCKVLDKRIVSLISGNSMFRLRYYTQGQRRNNIQKPTVRETKECTPTHSHNIMIWLLSVTIWFRGGLSMRHIGSVRLQGTAQLSAIISCLPAKCKARSAQPGHSFDVKSSRKETQFTMPCNQHQHGIC